MAAPTHSVVICTHNRCQILEKALRSHLLLTVPEGVSRELILVDNASTDRTAEVVREFTAICPFPVRYLYEPRLGHSVALNTGVAGASGDILVFTDDDAFPEPDWLVAIHQEFLDEQTGWVYGPSQPLWETGQPSWFGPEVAPWFAILNYGDERFIALEESHPFFGVNHACRRDILRRLGGYSEALGINGSIGVGGNDEDLYRRALALGIRIVYTPRAKVSHSIPQHRCEKSTHRRKVWQTADLHYRSLLLAPPAPPWALNLPRYFFRKPFDHFCQWAIQSLRRNPSGAFRHEVETIKYIGLIYHALVHRFRVREGSQGNRPLLSV